MSGSSLGKCDATDEVKSILRAMARAKVKEGITDAHMILDHIHDAIGEHTMLAKGQIADIVSGYGNVRKQTRDEMRQRINGMRAEMRDLSDTQDKMLGAKNPATARDQAKRTKLRDDIADLQRQIDYGEDAKQSRSRVNGPDDEELNGLKKQLASKQRELDQTRSSPPAVFPKDPTAAKNSSRQKILQRMIDDYNARIKRGDYSPTARPEKPKYSAETMALQGKKNEAINRWKNLALEDQRSRRTTYGKMFDRAVELKRTALLMSPPVYAKLASAAATKIAFKTAEEGVGNLLSHIPGVSRIADKAYFEGRTTGAIEKAVAKQTFSKDTLDAMWDTLRTGTNKFKSAANALDDPHLQAEFKLSRAVGNSHEMLKTPLKINIWKRSVLKGMESERRAMEADGKYTPEEISDHLNSAEFHNHLNALAWSEANREALSGKNLFNDMYNGLQARLKQEAAKGGARGAVAAGAGRLMKWEFPVTNVPINWAIQKASYAGGGIAAIAHLAAAADKGLGNKFVLKNAINNLTREQADSIMRNMKRQAVGVPLMAIGYYLYQNFGGMYQQGDSKNKNKPDSESVKIGSAKIPKSVLENPALSALQTGATAAWVDHKPKSDRFEGALAGAKSLIADNPFIEDTAGLAKGFNDVHSLGQWAGKEASSVIPAPISWAARTFDNEEHRKPKTGLDEIKMKIPGYRETVPRQ